MCPTARLTSLLRNLLRRDRVERDLDDELRSMADLLTAEKTRAGMAPEEARRAARVEMGSLESIKEGIRDVRRGASLDAALIDIRHAVRLLLRNPLFTVTATLSLAVGIGSTTTVFTVANGLLLRPAEGVANSGRLIDLVRRQADQGPGLDEVSYPDYVDIRTRARTFEDVFGYRLEPDTISLAVDDGVEPAFATVVTNSYFEALGVTPRLGRTFSSSDSERAGASPVLVVSHTFWQRRFGGATSVVGRTVRINGYPFSIIGVAREGFRGTSIVAPDVWVPVSMIGVVIPEGGGQLLVDRRLPWLMLGARLAPDMSRAQASAEMAAIGAALDREFPQDHLPFGPGASAAPVRWTWTAERASPIPYGLRTLATGFLSLLMAIVATVLVVACANVAGVLLARGTVRRRELSVRAAIGAARARIVRQLLTETILLFLIGGVAGLVLARVMTSMLLSLLPRFAIPISVSVPLDARVVLFSLGSAFLTAVLFGLAPALSASRTDVSTVLKDTASGTSERMRLRNAFVAAQVAFSLVLVVIAGLLVRTLSAVTTIEQEFNPKDVDMVSVDLSAAGYAPPAGHEFARQVMERVRALPGVQSATLADRPPGPGAVSFGGVTVPGVTPPTGQPTFLLNWTLVETGYFETLQLPLTAGRDFTATDRQVAIVGQGTADILWPDRNPIGEVLFVHSAGVDSAMPVSLTVIGVASDIVFGTGGRRQLALYVPYQDRYAPQATIFIRRSSDRSMIPDVRTVLGFIDPALLVVYAGPLELEQNGPVETQLRAAGAVAGAVGAVGLMLAAMGVYGVTAYTVTRRTREIGIRITLGARRIDVVWMVMRQGMALVGIGSVVGLLLGVGAGRLLAASPLRVIAADPAVFAVGALLFALVGAAACYVPVYRATRINPTQALRCE
jgi:predicted permease